MASRAADELETQLALFLTAEHARLTAERAVVDRVMAVFPTLLLIGAWAGIGYSVAHVIGAICAGVIGALASVALLMFVSRLRIG